jgi:hypothetical protein
MRSTKPPSRKFKAPKVIGRLVAIDLPLFGIEGVIAKVDTGAFSGALHATRIREIKDSQGITRLHFSPLGKSRQTLTADSFRKKRVKSSNGLVSTRYAINTQMRIQGQVQPITITLADRGSMRHPMIIGREFLNTHGFLIDVSNNKQ